MFKNYTINQTTLPLDIKQYISETDVAFAVNALVEAMPQTLFLELEEQLVRPTGLPPQNYVKNYSICLYAACLFWSEN
ncbi:hypothetical protein EB14_00582 [Enterococcus faecium]|nr:hypothetical protein EB14_00582 [Enterococcus faecium]